jgi:hypothetical protein
MSRRRRERCVYVLYWKPKEFPSNIYLPVCIIHATSTEHIIETECLFINFQRPNDGILSTYGHEVVRKRDLSICFPLLLSRFVSCGVRDRTKEYHLSLSSMDVSIPTQHEIDCNQTAKDLPPVTSAVFLIAK